MSRTIFTTLSSVQWFLLNYMIASRLWLALNLTEIGRKV